MKEIISRCGFRCDECPAFAGNNKTFIDQLKTAAGWSRYFGLKISPDRLRCNGCLAEDCSEYDLPESDCPIRHCVVERKMNTCADCFDYPCRTVQKRMKGVEEALSKFKGKISQEEFDTFLAPYEFRKTLEEIRDRRTDRID